MRWLALASLLFTDSAPPAPSAQVDWAWDRDTPSCALRQAVSADGTTLEISRVPGSDQTSISVSHENSNPNYRAQQTLRDADVRFAPGSDNSKVVAFATKSTAGQEVVATSNDTDFLNKFGRSNAIEFTHEKLGSVKAPVRSAAAAVEALRTCEDAKMREWGIDPVAWRALKARPIPLKVWYEWIGPDDYPATAIMNGIQGVVIPKMLVGADGSVVSCESIRRNRSATYRDRICQKLKQRARFKPALDGNGNPVAAPFVLVIKFRLEG